MNVLLLWDPDDQLPVEPVLALEGGVRVVPVGPARVRNKLISKKNKVT